MLMDGIEMPISLTKIKIRIQINPNLKSLKKNSQFKTNWLKFINSIDDEYDFKKYGKRIVKANKINQWLDQYFTDPSINRILKIEFQKLIRGANNHAKTNQ